MPKQSVVRNTRRPAPYHSPMATTMPSQLYQQFPMGQASNGWQATQYQQGPHDMTPLIGIVSQTPASRSQRTPHFQHTPQMHSIQPTQSGPWTSHEDEILEHARSQSAGWSQIAAEHFPNKTPNACRKRHERLRERRRGTDWDEARIGRVANGYRERREQMWRPLAEKLGERWEHVEKVVRARSR